MSKLGTYPMPEHGWTCFFCGETFTTPGAARDHFGADPIADTACRIKFGEERGLVMALRKAEAKLALLSAPDDRMVEAAQADLAESGWLIPLNALRAAIRAAMKAAGE